MAWESELLLAAAIGAWIVYEAYGRTAFDWIAQWTTYIRLVGGIVLIIYVWWQFRDRPEEFRDTLDFAKEMLTSNAVTGGAGRVKRNVTGLMKKKIAAAQEWRCGHCKSVLDETYEVDHIRALFQGGTNDESNLVALCPNCHRKKTVNERLEN